MTEHETVELSAAAHVATCAARCDAVMRSDSGRASEISSRGGGDIGGFGCVRAGAGVVSAAGGYGG